MESISIILTKSPYGSVDAAEAVRHALGAVIEDMTVSLFLLDGGVNAAKKGQDTSSTSYLSLESGISDCIEMGVKVYTDRTSLKESNRESAEIVEGIEILGASEIAEIIQNSDVTMIF